MKRAASVNAVAESLVILAAAAAVFAIARLPIQIGSSLSVAVQIARHLPMTGELLFASFVIAVPAGAVLSLVSTRFGDAIPGRAARGIALLLSAIPFFWLAAILQFRFGVLGPFPAAGFASVTRFVLADRVMHVFLPALTLALFQIRAITETLDRRFAQGPDRRTPAALLSGLVALLADRLPELIAADVIVEMFYAWPGEARLFASHPWFASGAFLIDFLTVNALLVVAVRLVASLASPRSLQSTDA